jgi:hypothetical protein
MANLLPFKKGGQNSLFKKEMSFYTIYYSKCTGNLPTEQTVRWVSCGSGPTSSILPEYWSDPASDPASDPGLAIKHKTWNLTFPLSHFSNFLSLMFTKKN